MNKIFLSSLIICIIFIFYFLNKIIVKEYFISSNKICCIYAYYEKNDLYRNNFKYFLDNAILNDVDYYIIINGKCSVKIPNKNNLKVYYRENKGYDFGAYSYALKEINKSYNYYFFINTSVRGPYLKDSSKKWTEPFLELLNNDTKLAGTSINIFAKKLIKNKYNLTNIYKKDAPYIHVQSMFFCIDNEALQFLKNVNFFNEEEMNNATDIQYIIAYKEIGLSQILLKNNWNINCILPKYKNIDYRKLKEDINSTSLNGDPYLRNKYFGNTINKYDVIFFKTNRFIDL